MSENKTVPTGKSVTAFLNAVQNERRRADAKVVAKMMRDATGCRPKMWGPSIVGYGSYEYKYDSGREGTGAICAYSPRKANLVVYIMPGFSHFGPLMKKLGKFKTGSSCLYINRLDDIDQKTLKRLIDGSVKYMRKKYKTGK